MKLIKTSSNVQIIMSKPEWQHIGVTSGWVKEAQDTDLTRQKADTDKLFQAMAKLRTDLGAIQNNNDIEQDKAIKERILETLNDLKQNNWVAKLDAEIGLDIDNLVEAINSNNIVAFNKVLESYFKPNLEESKAQLHRQMQKQKGVSGTQGVAVGLEQGVPDTGDSYT